MLGLTTGMGVLRDLGLPVRAPANRLDVAGKVDHRDKLLTPGERAETMLTCVSRSAGGPLVLDL